MAEGIFIGKKEGASSSSKDVKIQADLNGETVSVQTTNDKTILESMIEAGHDAPYSCMDGSCMSCLAKINLGLVWQRDEGVLSEEDISSAKTLTCQAFPRSKEIFIDYDDTL